MTSVSSHTELYVAVQQFYARQMQKLDRRELEAYADTFTEDGVFGHARGEQPSRTRAGILSFLKEFHKRFETDPMQRRHHFNMIDLRSQDDGSIATSFYAMVFVTRPGRQTELGASCTVEDCLVWQDGELLTRSRLIELDKDR
ncbi:MAG: nuclear transport factor 2 family protein [Pseudonocardiaceae bacterium]